MSFLTHAIDTFCEIKSETGYAVICTGNIVSFERDLIVLKNIVSFMKADNFKGIITIISKNRGLQVFKADVKQITADSVVIDNLQRIVNADRRAGYRMAVGLPALVTIDSEPGVGYDTIIQDMSVSGISISVHKSFKIDDIIRVQFPLDPENSHICVADCNVVRTIGSVNYSMRRYGCEFSEVSASDRQLINAYLTQLRTKQMRIEQSLI